MASGGRWVGPRGRQEGRSGLSNWIGNPSAGEAWSAKIIKIKIFDPKISKIYFRDLFPGSIAAILARSARLETFDIDVFAALNGIR